MDVFMDPVSMTLNIGDILVSTEASTDNAKQTTMACPTISMAEVKESCF